MLKIAYDPVFAHPLPEGHRFPMMKYELIPGQLLHEGLITPANLFVPAEAEDHVITRAHAAEYWQRLKNLELTYHEIRRIGFPLSDTLVKRERMIAQGTVDCARYALQYGVAMNVAGGTHHAGSDWGEGFCLLNDIAIAVHDLLHEKLAERILIVDLDVHQGNGTAEIFSGHPQVFTFSMHGANNFPYRKESSYLDLPLEDHTGDEVYLGILYETLPALIEKLQPDFIFYLSGVDILETDKLGKLSLSIGGCKERDRFVLQSCNDRRIPLAISMGGGYSADLRVIVEAHCNTYRLAEHIYF